MLRVRRFTALAVALVALSLTAAAPQSLAPGAVVGLAGTPHLWIADSAGILHWGGDTRALAGKHVNWNDRRDVSLAELQSFPIGDPWLSAGLLKDSDPIYLVKWESAWPQPKLLHIQSIKDVELFGINGSNYGNFVLDKATWEQRYGIAASGLQREVLARAVPPVLGTRETPFPVGHPVTYTHGWRIEVTGSVPNANRAVADENRFNDPPQPGHQFFMARLRVTRTAPGADYFYGEGDIRAVGNSGVAYADFRERCGVIPDELEDTRDLFQGGTIWGNVCWQIRSSDADSLVMYYEVGDKRWFFALR